MKDKQLFQKIKTIIKQKDIVPHEQKSRTFAQKYCKQQLLKRKLNPYNPNHKMNHLMQHFKGLQTYISLPQLIELLNLEPVQEDQKQINKVSSILQKQKPKENLLIKIKRLLSQQIRQKYVKQNQQIQGLLNFLENQSSFRSQGLKNTSENNFNYLYQQVIKQRNDILSKDDFDFLKFLQKNQQNKLQTTQELLAFQKDTKKIKEVQIIMKKKKQTYNLLRKIVTYLQIIQQSEHKKKWNSKYQKINLTPLNSKIQDINNIKKNIKPLSQFNKQNLQKNTSKFNSTFQSFNKTQKSIKKSQALQKIKLNDKKDNTPLQLMKKKHMHQQHMSLHLNKYHFMEEKQKKINKNNQVISQKCTNLSSFYDQSLQKKKNTSGIKRFQPLPSNQNLLQKNKSIVRHDSLIKQNYNINKDIKKSFTFRNRNIKQKIINKLTNFIRQIDDQQIINKRQTNYYNSIIEKLDKTLRTSFNQFNQQSITNQSDIQHIKAYAGSSKNNLNYCNVPLIQGKLIRFLGLDSQANISNGFQKTNFNRNNSFLNAF